jgi:hypothetical protein
MYLVDEFEGCGSLTGDNVEIIVCVDDCVAGARPKPLDDLESIIDGRAGEDDLGSGRLGMSDLGGGCILG